MQPDWRIYYADGSTFDSTDGPVRSAPREGFLVAIGYDEQGRRYIMHGWDFYRFDEPTAQWWGHDISGLLDWAKATRRVRRVKPGAPTVYETAVGGFDAFGLIEHFKQRGEIFEARTVTRSAWSETLARCNADPDFPIGGR